MVAAADSSADTVPCGARLLKGADDTRRAGSRERSSYTSAPMEPRRTPRSSVDAARDGSAAVIVPDMTEPDAPAPPAPADAPRHLPRWALLVGLTALLAVPLVVALAVLRHPRWYPLGDLAQTEMRVRAVASGHPPLIGLPGRLGQLGNQGSHPGPMSFWALWPFYQLFGGQAWALEAASASLHVVAMATALWIAYRRGGPRLALGVAVVLAALARGYTAEFLTQAWNPYMPMLAWIVVLLALWSVVVGDLALLPVAVFAASFCMQTHLPYLGLCGGLVAVTLVFVFARAISQRTEDPDGLRRLLRWTGIAAMVGVVLWIPPLIDELTQSPGNLTVVWRELTNPPEPPIPARLGISWVLVHLNPWHILSHGMTTTSAAASIVPGIVVLIVWMGTVVIAARARNRPLLALHGVIAASLVFAGISLVRVHGNPWYYLTLWGWGICALLLLAVVWTVGAAVTQRARSRIPTWAPSAVDGSLALAVVVLVVFFSLDATSARVPAQRYTQVLRHVAPPVVRALDAGTVPGGGRSGHYLVSWTDPISIGSTGYGLFDELGRHHFRVGAQRVHRGGVPPYQLLDPQNATGVVHLSVGPDIEVWRKRPGVVQVVYYDPRSPAELAEYERLRARVKNDLEAIGRSDLVQGVDGSPFTASLDPRVPAPDQQMLSRMVNLALPTAVFVGPPSAQT